MKIILALLAPPKNTSIFRYTSSMSQDRQKYASQADATLLREMRDLAKAEGRPFVAVMEDAMREYLERHQSDRPREHVMAKFRSSVEKNRRLGELLAK